MTRPQIAPRDHRQASVQRDRCTGVSRRKARSGGSHVEPVDRRPRPVHDGSHNEEDHEFADDGRHDDPGLVPAPERPAQQEERREGDRDGSLRVRRSAAEDRLGVLGSAAMGGEPGIDRAVQANDRPASRQVRDSQAEEHQRYRDEKCAAQQVRRQILAPGRARAVCVIDGAGRHCEGRVRSACGIRHAGTSPRAARTARKQ